MMHFYFVYLMKMKEKTQIWKKKEKKALLKIGTAESSKDHVLLETSTELVKLVAQLNELIQHRESDFAMFYHKDKDKWIALVLSNWILGAFGEHVEYSS